MSWQLQFGQSESPVARPYPATTVPKMACKRPGTIIFSLMPSISQSRLMPLVLPRDSEPVAWEIRNRPVDVESSPRACSYTCCHSATADGLRIGHMTFRKIGLSTDLMTRDMKGLVHEPISCSISRDWCIEICTGARFTSSTTQEHTFLVKLS